MKKKRCIYWMITLLCAGIFLPVHVKADMGPKASVHIQFENMSDEICYGTLLSKEESTGPASVWSGWEDDARVNEKYPDSYYFPRDIWEAFVNYEDPDGYYFLQEGWTISETKEIAWTYYPPSSFKILLYYPETNTFVSSGIYERYAFDTYYTVDMQGIQMNSVNYNDTLSTDERNEAYRSYKYRQEMLALSVRIILTILIEMVVAICFGFRTQKQLLVLALVNILTQILLNVALNMIQYNAGPMAFKVFYVFLEAVVFGIEAVFYCAVLKKISVKKNNGFYILYSFVANMISFVAGLFLYSILPGIF